MRSRNTQPIFILLTGFIIFIFGIVGADAQGNGHGNKHGGGENHGNRGGEDRGGGKHRDGNEGWQGRGNGNGNGRWQREERREERSDRGRRDDRQEQPRQDDRRVYQDRERGQRQAERNYGESRRQRRDDDRREDRRGQQQQWNPQSNPWGNIWPQSYRNYGQSRSEEVHQRNAERKAWKNERKAMRYYEQAYPRYSYQNRNYSYYNDNDRNYYGSQSQDRAGVLRSLIANVLGSNNYLSGAQSLYSGEQYYEPQYRQNSRSYASAPNYYDYQPSYAYDPQYNNDNYGPDYGNSDSGLLGGLPFGNFTDLIGGDGFVGQMLGNLLAVGYEQGYFQGLDALQAGSGTGYYSDPYTYSGTNYLSSSSLGENRSCLSNGYQLGYNDALNNQGASVLDQDTNVDLVSLLLGNALQVL